MKAKAFSLESLVLELDVTYFCRHWTHILSIFDIRHCSFILLKKLAWRFKRNCAFCLLYSSSKHLLSQSHYMYISHVVSNYGTEIEIWAGFGPVGSTEKKLGANYEQHLRLAFSCFQGQNNTYFIFFLNIVASALKSCIKWRWKKYKFFRKI